MIVYLVTSGSDYEYQVYGVYSTMEKAEQAKKLFACEFIDEMELDAFPYNPPGLFAFHVLMTKEGEVLSALPKNAEYMGTTEWMPSLPENKKMLFCMWAKDETDAIKIANEKRAMLIATNQWGIQYKDWKEKQGVSHE